jgi:hypothetical protein
VSHFWGALQNSKQKNTGDLQGENAANYNARPCNDERKAAGAKTMENRKKQCAEQWKQVEIQAHADALPGRIDTPQKQSPAAERRRAHRSKTRVSAIAHPSAERTSKSAPVIPEAYQRRLQYPLIRGGLRASGGEDARAVPVAV